MTKQLKQEIINAALAYMNFHNLTNNEVSRKAEINSGYLSLMLRGEFKTTVNKQEFEIPDRWFLQLAKYVNHEVKKPYWHTVHTVQFKEVISTLELCKKNMRTSMLICDTGLGKSFAVDQFCNQNPHDTFKLVVSTLYRLDDVLDEMAALTGVEKVRNRQQRLKRIIDKLRELKLNGGHPIIIFDEAENLEISCLRMLKGLFDGVKDYCSVVMIGTDQLLEKLTNLTKRGVSARNRNSIPQLYSRFKLGRRDIAPLKKERDFPFFYQKMGITDNKVIALAYDVCDTYRDLNNFFEPVLRDADEKKFIATEEIYRLYHNIKKK